MENSAIKNYKQILHDELFDSVLPFWENHGPDPKYGGINTCIDRTGKLYSKEKSVWMQGRGGWMFAHLCEVFGEKKEWVSISKSCIDFMNQYCIDRTDGRLYFVVGEDGIPFRKRRYHFSEYFYIMAVAEYHKVTGDVQCLENARKYYGLVKGIYEDPGSDPFKITPKSLSTAPQMRGLGDTLVMLLVSRTMRQCDPERASEYVGMEKRLIDEILNYHLQTKFGVLLEGVGPKGEYLGDYSSGRVVNPGHNLETVWNLLREAEELEDNSFLEQIETIYKGAFRYGWDDEYGGLLYFVDVEGNPPQAYEHDMKLWWVHTEALIASIKLYRMTGKNEYLNNFSRVLDYSLKGFQDSEYGEWFGYLRRDGKATMPPSKGNIFKGPFHVPRMFCEVLSELSLILEEPLL